MKAKVTFFLKNIIILQLISMTKAWFLYCHITFVIQVDITQTLLAIITKIINLNYVKFIRSDLSINAIKIASAVVMLYSIC